METPILKTKIYPIELNVVQFDQLKKSLAEIIDQSSRFGIFENSLVSDMAFSHIDIEEPEMIEPIMNTVSVISGTYLALSNADSILRNITKQLWIIEG